MMNKFMDENFLLKNSIAINLYKTYAKDMPIIDYHCHINPKEILENKRFNNITEAWLYGDHYKWRAMRAFGIDEKYITGDVSDYEKFLAYAKTIEMAIGNPLYHWTHLELQRYFGVHEVLNEKTAPSIWKKVNEMLKSDGFRVQEIIKKLNVEIICTTDDPTDSLEYHKKIKDYENFNVKVLPAFRPDKALGIEKEGFVQYVAKLGQVCDKNIDSLSELVEALKIRIKFFHENGCRVSDHALGYVPCIEASEEEVSKIFVKALNGEKAEDCDEDKYKFYLLNFLGKIYSKLGWTMQLHINALRNTNTKMFNKIGPDAGYDTINDSFVARKLTKFLDSLEKENSLPKTILYSVNSNDNYILAAIAGCFQGDGIKGKVQFGAAWWYNDTKDGMLSQMKTLANVSLLSTFVGMLTDSRSFLSYTRHEYFRRILCNMIGEWAENGEVPCGEEPNGMELLGKIVQNISYYNAKNYFRM